MEIDEEANVKLSTVTPLVANNQGISSYYMEMDEEANVYRYSVGTLARLGDLQLGNSE